MTSRFILPFSDVGSGIKPPNGAKLSFFEGDGVTFKDTHTTKAANIANANPVIALSTGVFPAIYITGDYLATLTDKDDNQIFGLAPVNEFAVVTDSAFVKNFDTLTLAIAENGLVDGDTVNLKERTTNKAGGALWDVVLLSSVIVSTGAPGVGAVVAWGNNTGAATDLALVLRVQGSANVAEFGGQGSVSSDSAGIQSAADYARDNKVSLVFPDGTYLIGTTIALTSPGGGVESYRNIEVIVGREAEFRGVLASTNLFDISGQRRFTWTGGRFLFGNKMFFQDDNSSTAPTASTYFYGVIFAPTGSDDIGRCYQADTSIGVYWTSCIFGTDLASNAIDVAIHLTGASSQQTNINVFNSCIFRGIKTGAVLFDVSSFNRAVSTFNDCWFENINGFVFKGENFTRNVTFKGCYFEATGSAGAASIILIAGARIAIDGGFIAGVQNNATSFVSVTSGGEITTYGDIDFVSDGTRRFLNLITPAGLNRLHGINIFGTASQDYETLLFGPNSNLEFVDYSIPRITSTLTTTQRQDTHTMNTSYNGFINHQTKSINIASQDVDFVMATVNVPNTGHPMGRFMVDIHQTIQGVGVAGRSSEWVTHFDGANWIFTVITDTTSNVGWLITPKSVDANTFTISLRRTSGAGTNTPAQIAISGVQASASRAANQVTIS